MNLPEPGPNLPKISLSRSPAAQAPGGQAAAPRANLHITPPAAAAGADKKTSAATIIYGDGVPRAYSTAHAIEAGDVPHTQRRATHISHGHTWRHRQGRERPVRVCPSSKPARTYRNSLNLARNPQVLPGVQVNSLNLVPARKAKFGSAAPAGTGSGHVRAGSQ